MSQKPLPLECLIEEAYKRLERLGYSANTRTFYRRVWQRLLRWSQEHGVQTMTPDVGVQFLEFLGIPPGKPPEPLNTYCASIRTTIRVLEDFALYGHWGLLYQITQTPPFPPRFETVAEGFLEYRQVTCGIGPQALRFARRYLLRFTLFLESRHIEKWTDIQPGNLPAFFATLTRMQPVSLVHVASSLRKFLKYLWLQQLHPYDLSFYLPQFAKGRQHVPPVWRQEEVDALLAAVDRGSAIGKRDYAVLLLAARLGLRGKEIRSLKLEHIRWEKSQLELLQSKTGNTLVLPLSEEVGDALIDYLRNGRPPVTCREVFVRHLAPLQPFADSSALYGIITRCAQRAHIRTDVSRRRGLHSLRYTLATRMLEQETPIETIAAVLGHDTVESTFVYTRANLKLLRSAALDPEGGACHE